MKGLPIPNLPSILDPAGASVRGVLPGRPSSNPAPVALVSDPGELVARALAILTEDTQAWALRQPPIPRGGSPR